MRAAAIVPVKRFGTAKQRLGGALDPRRRARLAAAMLEDVLAALSRSRALDEVMLVSGEPRAAEIATAAGIEVLDDPADRGHSQAALIGIATARQRGVTAAALLPGDCPLIDVEELDRALGGLEDAGRYVGVVPDRHRTGTNGLLLSPPDAIEPAFGPGSCERHLRLARERGARGELMALGSLAFDLDTADDLQQLLELLAGAPAAAPATADALAAIGVFEPGKVPLP